MVLSHVLAQFAFATSSAFASSRIIGVSRSKNTSASGRSAFNSASDLRPKSSCAFASRAESTIEGRGAGNGAAGGDVVAPASPPDTGPSATCGGTRLWQPAAATETAALRVRTEIIKRERVIDHTPHESRKT